MTDDQIGVNLVQFSDESLQHLLFILVNEHLIWFALLGLLLSIVRQRYSVQLTNHRKRLELLLLCGTVLIDLVLNDAWDHRDFSRVVLRAREFTWEGHADQRWRRFVQIVEGADAVFGILNLDFVLGPWASLLDLRDSCRVTYSEPAGPSNLPLKNE